MRRKLVFGLALVLALSGIVIGVIGIIASQEGANNLGVISGSATLGAVLLTLVYTRLCAADQAHK